MGFRWGKFILGTCIVWCAATAMAADPKPGPKRSAVAASKPGVVLLPVQGAELSAIDREQYRSALANALAEKYQVYSGAEVDKKLQAYAKKTCDAEKCLVEITADYQAALVGRSIVAREADGFTVTVEVVDIYSDNRSEISDTRACPRCNKAGVIDVLKSIATGRAVAKAATNDEALEKSAWAIAKPQDSLEGYGTFLASFPAGVFAEPARMGFDNHASRMTAEQKVNTIAVWLAKSRQHFIAQQFPDAVRLSRMVLLLEPKEEAAMLNLATALFMSRQFEDAEIAAQKLLAANPAQGSALNLLGALKEREGLRSDAAKYFKQGCGLKHEVSCRNEERLDRMASAKVSSSATQ